MIRALAYLVVWLASGAVSTFLGAQAYKHRARLALAVRVLRGQASIDGGVAKCEREHLESSCVQIKKDDFEKLKKAARELTFAQGYIVRAEKKDYAKTVSEVVDGR